MDIKEKIEELRAELHRHNYNYYVLNAPEISIKSLTIRCVNFRIWNKHIRNIKMKIHHYARGERLEQEFYASGS